MFEPLRNAEIDALGEAYAALNRNDIAGFVKDFDPQVERFERFEPAGIPSAGTYRGLAAVTEHVSRGRGSWAVGSCTPERYQIIGDRVVVFVAVRVKLKSEPEWREGRTVDVFTFRQGRVVQFCSFVDEREALEWARVGAAGAR